VAFFVPKSTLRRELIHLCRTLCRRLCRTLQRTLCRMIGVGRSIGVAGRRVWPGTRDLTFIWPLTWRFRWPLTWRLREGITRPRPWLWSVLKRLCNPPYMSESPAPRLPHPHATHRHSRRVCEKVCEKDWEKVCESCCIVLQCNILGHWCNISTCHIGPQHVPPNVSNETFFVPRNGLRYGSRYGLRYGF
jgi:hypothetical protein